MVYDETTITSLFRTEFYTYERLGLLAWVGVAMILVLLGVFGSVPAWCKVLCLLLGCWMMAARDFPARIQAEGVLQSRKGAVSHVKCRLHDGGVDVENGMHLDYTEIDRMMEDKDYFYLFKDRQTAVVLPRKTLCPASPERLCLFLERKTGKQWRPANAGLLSINLKDLRQIVRDKATRRRQA